MNAEILNAAGIDYSAGLTRFLNDEELYSAVFTAFLDDNVLQRAIDAYNSGDRSRLMKVVHEAKGSCGNAGLNESYQAASALMQLLRSGAYTDEALAASFRTFSAALSGAREAIRKAL